MRKIIVKRGIQVGSTIGAFMYAYYIHFQGETSHAYSFHATKEGMGYAIEAWKDGGYEVQQINLREDKKDQL